MLAVLVVVGVPAAAVFLLGAPELALPSEWPDARSRIDDGTLPVGYIVDVLSGALLLAWIASLWLLVSSLREWAMTAGDEEADPIESGDGESGEPWYRQGQPLFDEQFSDDFPRVVVPDDMAPGDDEARDSVWAPGGDESRGFLWETGAVPAGAAGLSGMLPDDAMAEDGVSDAEIIDGPGGASSDEPPMIVPVRAYYFTRAEDTLRSISAQFLETPMRWQELRSLNAASPGVAAMGPDSLLPPGTALALPGDPLPWGKPDPVYLWTLAEKFLFTAWGREPTPEEVVPFWRGLTGGAQLESGVSHRPEHLAAPESVAEAVPAPEVTHEAPEPEPEPEPPEPEPEEPEPEPEPEPPEPEPEPPEPEPELELEPEPEPPEPEEPEEPEPEPEEPEPEPELEPEPEPEPPEPELEPAHEPAPAPPVYQPPVPPSHEPLPAYQPPVPPSHEPLPAYQPPVPPSHEPPPGPPVYQPPVPPSHEPPPGPPVYQPPVPPSHEPPPGPPVYQPPVPPSHEPPPGPPVYQPPVPPSHEPPPGPPVYQPPVPPSHEPPPGPPVYQPPVPPSHEPPPGPPVYQPPVPPSHEPLPGPPVYQPPVPPYYEPGPPAYEPPVPPSYEPAPPGPPVFEPPVLPSREPGPPGSPVFEPPVLPSREPPPVFEPSPVSSGLGGVDFGPVESEVAHVEVEAPRMPSFLPSLTGAEPARPASDSEVVASSSRSLAGTAVGDAMMLWQLARLRRRGGAGRDAVDPLEESLRLSARVDSLNLIEAAMRHLRAVTVGRLREKPAVLAVRVGSYGFEVLLNRPAEAPEGWRAASAGFVLELPEGVAVDDLDAVGQGPSLCPALVPVGDTLEGPLLLNVEEIGCLIVSGPGSASVSLLNAVVATLGSSPLAGDIRVITVGLDTPAGLVGWEKVHSTSFDSAHLEGLLSAAHTGGGALLDVLVVGPGNDLLIQRAGQVATAPGSRLAVVGATSSVTARWPWRIHVDETTTAVVHPIACTMAAAQATAPAMSQLFGGASELSPLAPRRL